MCGFIFAEICLNDQISLLDSDSWQMLAEATHLFLTVVGVAEVKVLNKELQPDNGLRKNMLS